MTSDNEPADEFEAEHLFGEDAIELYGLNEPAPPPDEHEEKSALIPFAQAVDEALAIIAIRCGLDPRELGVGRDDPAKGGHS